MRRSVSGSSAWDVPYLPLDPQGRRQDGEAIIRVNFAVREGRAASPTR